jgi:segregation and condensation protein A
MSDELDDVTPGPNGTDALAAAAEANGSPDLSVESPAARDRDGGPIVRPRQPGVTFKLPRFEGPLDLLLHLLKRDEIDIHDIPISHITKQYLDYIELMRMLDLDVAGEFLVMAATLMRIKAKMLLPLPSSNDDEEEGDPREELVQRLMEYRLYKEAAGSIQEREAMRRTWHERGQVPTEDDAGPLPLAPATLFDLLGALQRVMARRPQQTVYTVQTEEFDIEDKMSLLARTVAEEGELRFSQVMLRDAPPRMEIIVSFIGAARADQARHRDVVQEANFADILILPRLHGREGPRCTQLHLRSAVEAPAVLVRPAA